ncbi:MAG TPA: ATP-binding protein, partial [Acidimicrobiales bacterium]
MKLAGALVVPLVALVVVTILEVVSISGEVDDVKAQARLAETSLGPSSLVTKLEYERDAAAVYLIGQEGAVALPVEDNAQARADMDAAVAEFRTTIQSMGGDVAAVYRRPLEALDQLAELRAEVDGYDDSMRGFENVDNATTSFNHYTELMNTFFDANRQVILAIEDVDLRRGAELYDLSAHQTDVMAKLVRDLLLTALAGDANGLDEPTEISGVAQLLGRVRANEQLIRLKAEGAYRPMAERLFATDHIVQFPREVQAALDSGSPDVGAVLSTSTGDDAEAFGYTVFRNEVSEELQAQADDVRAAADARLRRYIVLAVVAMGVTLLVTWLVSRSITRPLRSLTRQAKEMAERRLPVGVRQILETPLGDDVEVPTAEPVVVQTRDEVADVADALNSVQDSALDLAVEQAMLRRNIADSFVNLGRRNQNLLGRQLDFITELESNETDPDTLASLFRLDHLATRMRRNAESLLVLAGIDPPRKWAAPVRLNDVIRAALSEVEDYQRVVLRQVEPATIMGSAAADLAHLVAEFVENALTFSPPDRNVDVWGRRAGDGYRLTIIDAGFGMSEADVAQANRRLVGAESFTIAPSKYLGHYVAGNLAARHGVAVRLDSPGGEGITVTIELPPALLTTEASSSVPLPPSREAVPDAAPDLAPVPAAVGAGEGGGLHVLGSMPPVDGDGGIGGAGAGDGPVSGVVPAWPPGPSGPIGLPVGGVEYTGGGLPKRG